MREAQPSGLRLSILLPACPAADWARMAWLISVAHSWQDAADRNLLPFLQQAATTHESQKQLKSYLSGCCLSRCCHLQSMLPKLNLYDLLMLQEFTGNFGSEAKQTGPCCGGH